MLTLDAKFIDALVAQADGAAVKALEVGDDVGLAAYLNGPSDTTAWPASVSRAALQAVTDIAAFAALSDGFRDAWRMLLDSAPLDLTSEKTRADIAAIWRDGADAMLAALVVPATRAEVLIGGEAASAGAVSALVRAEIGSVDIASIGKALNTRLRADGKREWQPETVGFVATPGVVIKGGQ